MRMSLSKPVAIWVSLLVAVVAMGTLVAARSGDPEPPAWRGNASACRADPMAHVHDPSRLEVLQNCSSFTGTVESVRFVPAFDDLKITLVPTSDMRRFLPGANHGRLVADVIPTDQAAVTAPAVGSRITVSGAWVHDKATKSAMMLPAYRIEVDEVASTTLRGESKEKHGPSAPKKLQLTVTAASRVPVGGEIHATIRARWSLFGALSPASQVRLFTEMTTPDGSGVRWKAIETDTRGLANLRMVAIQVPAKYQLTVYAAPSQQAVTATTSVTVAKR
jgi:hypothetical protein